MIVGILPVDLNCQCDRTVLLLVECDFDCARIEFVNMELLGGVFYFCACEAGAAR